jgi:Asp-tRNA(Asn)/Glu-tRNA(Gln) amidotransferase A subunit family amidase
MGILQQHIDWLESKEKTPADLVALCRQRIAEREPELRAWVEVSPQEALGSGALDGIPFAAKDTFETLGLSTAFGSSLFAGRKGATDAALVVQLRRLGAILLGKTQTTAFASFDPSPTRNPHNSAHTPGGSSSGSAAAVAAGMAAFSIGSQTQGSVGRPASYCGVAGFKPTYGLLSTEGLFPFAPTLDTPGLFTQDAGDMQLLWGRMGFPTSTCAPPICARPDSLDAEPEMEAALRQTTAQLKAAGFRVDTIPLPGWAELTAASRLVNQYEGGRTHEQVWRQHGAAIGAKLDQLISDGLRLSQNQYQDALSVIGDMKCKMDAVFREYPVVLTPAAPGPAPHGLESTGDPRMNSAWTALGTPAISVPMACANGLPLGLQMAARPGDDAMVLAFAVSASRAGVLK